MKIFRPSQDVAEALADHLEEKGIDTTRMTGHDLAAKVDATHPGGVTAWCDEHNFQHG